MRRRRYLQTAGASLSTLLAGCSTDALSGGTPTERSTSTATETATPTETDQYDDSPGDVEVPQYVDLLPNKHLGGTERTDNANFVRVDWEWYLRMMDEEMTFGVTSEEEWTLEPNEGNFQRPPQYDIIQAPVGGAIRMAYILEDIIGEFPNAGPEIIEQAGLKASQGQREAVREIDEIIGYAKPGVTYIVGANLDSFREAVADNPSKTYAEFPSTVSYQGVGRASGRNFIVTGLQERSVIAFESADQSPEDLNPTFRRMTNRNKSVAVNESVQWCLSQFTDSPIVVGEINGGQRRFSNSEFEPRPVEELPAFDTIFHGLDTNGYTATAQAVTSNIDDRAPSKDALLEVYGPDEGNVTTQYRPNTSQICVNWS